MHEGSQSVVLDFMGVQRSNTNPGRGGNQGPPQKSSRCRGRQTWSANPNPQSDISMHCSCIKYRHKNDDSTISQSSPYFTICVQRKMFAASLLFSLKFVIFLKKCVE